MEEEKFLGVFLALWGVLVVIVNIVFWIIEKTVYLLYWISVLIRWLWAYARRKAIHKKNKHARSWVKNTGEKTQRKNKNRI